jgi:glycosyltransferase involved in cell wall biosynthesis
MARMVPTNDDWCFLEIGIPTYNRCCKLDRLLTILERETATVSADVTIRVTVSDNNSSDATQSLLQQHSFRDKLTARTNPGNIGALRNIWGLYETTRADYVWILGDDDLPMPGSLQKIVDTLIHRKPTVLTFEFAQPPDAAPKRHGAKSGIEELTELSEAIPHILVLGKVSKHVINTAHLQGALRNVLSSRDTGYGWLLVILELIKLTSSPKIVLDHDFLAGSDQDFAQITDGLTPQFWDDYLLLLDHDIVSRNCPEYADQYRYAHPVYMVKMLYSVMAGLIKVADDTVFRKKGRNLRFYPRYLRNPFIAIQWVSLSLGLPALPLICRLADHLGIIKQRVLGMRQRGWA